MTFLPHGDATEEMFGFFIIKHTLWQCCCLPNPLLQLLHCYFQHLNLILSEGVRFHFGALISGWSCRHDSSLSSWRMILPFSSSETGLLLLNDKCPYWGAKQLTALGGEREMEIKSVQWFMKYFSDRQGWCININGNVLSNDFCTMYSIAATTPNFSYIICKINFVFAMFESWMGLTLNANVF